MESKIKSLEELIPIVSARRDAGKSTLVFTNGCFDLLHIGHIRYLQEAKKLGDLLIVGINSDTSVRSLEKAPGRPVIPGEQRAEVLSALAWSAPVGDRRLAAQQVHRSITANVLTTRRPSVGTSATWAVSTGEPSRCSASGASASRWRSAPSLSG